MLDRNTHFNRHSVRPLQCINEAVSCLSGSYWTLVGLTLLGIIIGGAVPLGILWGPMACGIYLLMSNWIERRQAPRVDYLFQGFDHFGQSLIATLISMAPVFCVSAVASVGMIVAMIRLQAAGGGNNPGAVLLVLGGFYGSLLTVSFLVAIFNFFVYQLIVDRHLSGWDAVVLSCKAAFWNLGGIVALLFLNGILNLAGMMLCGVGVALALPVNFASAWIAYRQVFDDQTLSEFADDQDDFKTERLVDDAPQHGIQEPPSPERY